MLTTVTGSKTESIKRILGINKPSEEDNRFLPWPSGESENWSKGISLLHIDSAKMDPKVLLFCAISLCAFGILFWLYIAGLCYILSEKNADKPIQTAGMTMTTKDLRQMKAMNDPTLNRYLEDFHLLCSEYKNNFSGCVLRELFSSSGSSYEQHLQSKVCNGYTYSRLTGKQNPTFGDYKKLLLQYQKDSLNARYRQLRSQKYNFK